MSSQRRIEASRANGAKSKGPKTPEGKVRSSQNAISHGLFADLTLVDVEHREGLLQLIEDYVEVVQPANPLELDLVEQMTAASWRMRRVWAMETWQIDSEICKITGVDDRTRLSEAHARASEKSNQLELLDRYEKRFHRIFHRAIHSLAALRNLPPPRHSGQPANPVPALAPPAGQEFIPGDPSASAPRSPASRETPLPAAPEPEPPQSSAESLAATDPQKAALLPPPEPPPVCPEAEASSPTHPRPPRKSAPPLTRRSQPEATRASSKKARVKTNLVPKSDTSPKRTKPHREGREQPGQSEGPFRVVLLVPSG